MRSAGDVSRTEILHKFDVGSAKACVVAIADMSATNKAVVVLRQKYPNLPLLVRAKDGPHKKRLQAMFGTFIFTYRQMKQNSVLIHSYSTRNKLFNYFYSQK